jgi:hypothetical protein
MRSTDLPWTSSASAEWLADLTRVPMSCPGAARSHEQAGGGSPPALGKPLREPRRGRSLWSARRRRAHDRIGDEALAGAERPAGGQGLARSSRSVRARQGRAIARDGRTRRPRRRLRARFAPGEESVASQAMPGRVGCWGQADERRASPRRYPRPRRRYRRRGPKRGPN